MKVLEVVNIHRQPLGRITWEPSEQLKLEILEAEAGADLNAFIERAKRDGFPRQIARQVENQGHRTILEERVAIKPGDENFLEVMADAIGRYNFGGQRAFGLIKKQQEGVS
jgi:hypothetical protein